MAEALVVAAALAVLVPAGLRWLRVAEREHYLAGSAGRFVLRWWTVSAANAGLLLAGVAGLAIAPLWRWTALGAAAAAALGPIGLGIKGTSSKLAWTRRLQRLAAITAVLVAVAGVVGAVVGRPGVVLAGAALFLPLVVDAAMVAARPVEMALAARWLRKAAATLDRIDPIRVAITGSYGKTTTKEYVRHLLAGSRSVVASPASFNNAMGLARAVNEHLAPGTEVFVAEMGTYGRGEIADLVRWVKPNVAVITAIGPVHLERFGTEDAIVAAKSEILKGAEWAVLNVDDPRLAALADAHEAAGGKVVRCSVAGSGADVSFPSGEDGHAVTIRGVTVGRVDELPAFPGNAACALGVALALDVSLDGVEQLLAGVSRPDHRQTTSQSDAGFTIIDDTYNSNPAGAASALERLAEHGDEGTRRVVVTPGMVELGRRQAAENRTFAAGAIGVADHLLVVGRTNRKALLAGAAAEPGAVTTVEDRTAAVAWVRSHLGPGDVVLYENDLPDHYP